MVAIGIFVSNSPRLCHATLCLLVANCRREQKNTLMKSTYNWNLSLLLLQIIFLWRLLVWILNHHVLWTVVLKSHMVIHRWETLLLLLVIEWPLHLHIVSSLVVIVLEELLMLNIVDVSFLVTASTLTEKLLLLLLLQWHLILRSLIYWLSFAWMARHNLWGHS